MDKEERDIAVDIFKAEKKMRVIAELPGLNEKDIRLDLNEDTLTISASRGKRSYYKNVRLPRVCGNIIGKMYNTGILEVTLD
ncbi:MAG: Hsp20/alpha crystallin family protein [Desulfobacterales bacterium]|nr:Hsp20/alpha crystallin family protein [Desulfobacterales bacterium]